MVRVDELVMVKLLGSNTSVAFEHLVHLHPQCLTMVELCEPLKLLSEVQRAKGTPVRDNFQLLHEVFEIGMILHASFRISNRAFQTENRINFVVSIL